MENKDTNFQHEKQETSLSCFNETTKINSDEIGSGAAEEQITQNSSIPDEDLPEREPPITILEDAGCEIVKSGTGRSPLDSSDAQTDSEANNTQVQNEHAPQGAPQPSQHQQRQPKREIHPVPPFPIDGLPEALRNLIKECVEVYSTPQDFWAAAIFVGTAAGMGNAIKLSGKYTNNSALWWMLVAPSGTGKSEPLDFALNPFKRRDANARKSYLVQKSEYNNVLNMSKKDRESRDIHETPPVPICRQTILKDFTPEAMAEVHGNNSRGIVLHRDELMGWINDIGRYAKSGEVETMLTIWSGKGLVVNRKAQDPLRIDDPCITIAGGVVVKKLNDLAKDGREDNGMVQRCMFVWPDSCEKPLYSTKSLPMQFISDYDKYISDLIAIPEGSTITLSHNAELLYAEFYNDNAEKSNAEKVDFIKEMYAKLDIIALRIALIVHGMKMVCEENTPGSIEPETMEYAIRVTEYFRATGMKVYDQLCANRTRKISTKDVILYLYNERGMDNRSEIGRILNVSPQYVSRVISESL